MFHVGRSGSTMLADLLNQHHDIAWSGELAKADVARSDLTAKARFSAFHETLRSDLDGLSGYPIYGFEIKPFHLKAFGVSPAEFVESLHTFGFTHFMVLERANYLRKVLSSLLASRTGTWHSPKNIDTRINTVRLAVDGVTIDKEKKALIDFMEQYSADFAAIRRAISGRQTLELEYERDLQQAPQLAAQQIYEFVGADSINPSVRYGRTNPHQLGEVLENAEEVQETLRGTPYEWMYDDAH